MEVNDLVKNSYDDCFGPLHASRKALQLPSLNCCRHHAIGCNIESKIRSSFDRFTGGHMQPYFDHGLIVHKHPVWFARRLLYALPSATRYQRCKISLFLFLL